MIKRVDFSALPVRVREKIFIEPNSGCWLWLDALSRKGYGAFYFDKKTYPAHQWIFVYFGGIISDGLQIDHLCRCKSCVNPLHLEAVTIVENVRRHWSSWVPTTHCSRGHRYVYRIGNQPVCRVCKNAAQRIRRSGVRRDLDELGAWPGE